MRGQLSTHRCARVNCCSLASLARKKNKSRRTIQKALDVPYKKSEQVIATALRVKPQQLWPERFDSSGRRIKNKPGRKPRRMERSA